MTNLFKNFMNDIFNNKDIVDEVYINGYSYICVCSEIRDGMSFTGQGLVNEQNFTIDLHLPIYPMPKIGDKIIFREKQYKISNITPDSANTSIKLSIIALSKSING